jgi:hypothetical protein
MWFLKTYDDKKLDYVLKFNELSNISLKVFFKVF